MDKEPDQSGLLEWFIKISCCRKIKWNKNMLVGSNKEREIDHSVGVEITSKPYKFGRCRTPMPLDFNSMTLRGDCRITQCTTQ